MGDYADLPGVRTWYETEGTGDPLVLLHGGFCTNDTWGRSAPTSPPRTASICPSGAGTDTPPTSKARSATKTWPRTRWPFLEKVVRAPAHLLGWSDGGIVALLVALARPDLVRRIVVIGANFRPEPALVNRLILDHLEQDAVETMAPVRRA